MKAKAQQRRSTTRRDDLVVEHQAFARMVAGKVISSLRLPLSYLDDAISLGYLGLLEAAERYNPESSVPFRGYAYLRIRGAIIDGMRGVTGSSRAHSRRVRRVQWALEDINESVPFNQVSSKGGSVDDSMGVLLDIVSRVFITYALSDPDVDGDEMQVAAPSEHMPDELLMQRRRAEWLYDALATLSAEDRFIIESIHVRELTLDEVGVELGGASRSWLCRKHARALDRLREALERER